MFRLLSILLLSFCTLKGYGQPYDVKIKTLPDTIFFIDPKIPLEDGLNYYVFNKKADFNKLFGLTKYHTEKSDIIDFKKELPIALALYPPNSDVHIKFVRAFKVGSIIEVFFTISRKHYPTTYTTYPLLIGTLPRIADVNTIQFYIDKELQKEVKIK